MLIERKRLGQSAGRKGDGMESPQRNRGWSWWYLLLIALCVVTLWVPLYNRVDPTFIGVPFFYWFQLFLVIVGAAITALVYFVE